jgi:hypothetical protein
MDHNLKISNNGSIIQIMLLLLSHDRARAFQPRDLNYNLHESNWEN